MKDPRLRGFEGLLKGPVTSPGAPPAAPPEPEPAPPAASASGPEAVPVPTVQCQVVVPEGAAPGTQLLVNVPMSSFDPNWAQNQQSPTPAAPAAWPLVLSLALPVLLAAAWQTGATAVRTQPPLSTTHSPPVS